MIVTLYKHSSLVCSSDPFIHRGGVIAAASQNFYALASSALAAENRKSEKMTWMESVVAVAFP